MIDKRHTRRDILQLGIIGAASLILPDTALSAIEKISPSEKKLSFYNTHTGEKFHSVYWAKGKYIKESIRSINWILRDHRSDQICEIDTELLNLLYTLQRKTGTTKTIHVVSGYRSPQTNSMLRKKSSKVAKKSLHMCGKAIDIRIPGFELTRLHRAALNLKQGGVGYYPQSDFIHVDVGKVRRW